MRLLPRAGADRIDGVTRSAEGRRVLKVRVTAPPAEDRANEALLRFLAREWRVARRDLLLLSGARSRSKTVFVAGDPAALMQRLGAAIGGLGGS